jgi:hypothetical protein
LVTVPPILYETGGGVDWDDPLPQEVKGRDASNPAINKRNLVLIFMVMTSILRYFA